MKKQITILTILLVMFLVPSFGLDGLSKGTNTREGKFVCINKLEYQLLERGTDVEANAGYITAEHLEKGFLDIEGSRDENGEEKESYKFTSKTTGLTCVKKPEVTPGFYEWETCPISNNIKHAKVEDIQANYELVEKADGSGFNLIIKGAYGLKFKITRQESFDYSSSSYNLTPDSKGNYTHSLAPGQPFVVSFAVGNQDKDCNGAYVGYFQGTTSKLVTNHHYYDGKGKKTANNAICYDFINSNKDYPFARALVPTCSSQKYVFQSGISPLNKIRQEITRATSLLKNTSSNPNNSNLKYICDFNENNNIMSDLIHTDVIRTSTNEYWAATCTEQLTIQYDTPKAVNVGGGFEYEVKLVLIRDCEPIQLKLPEIKDVCEYGIECWGGSNHYAGSTGAGPNEDFDECVLELDGGRYLQKTIDTCYEQVYGTTTSTTSAKRTSSGQTSKVEMISNKRSSYVPLDQWYRNLEKRKQDANDATGIIPSSKCETGKRFDMGGGVLTRNPLSSCKYVVSPVNCDPTSENIYGTRICYSEHGVGMGFHNVCSGTKCYEVFISDTDCSTNAAEALRKQINDAKNELAELNSLINSYTGKITQDEIDTYSFINAANPKKVDNFTTKSDQKLRKEENITVKSHSSKNVALSASESVEVSSYTVTREITFKVPRASVSRIKAGDIVYGKNRVEASYYDGGNMYYTDLNAGNFNHVNRWPEYLAINDPSALKSTSKEITKNIIATFKEYGSWRQWKNIEVDCFYGVERPGTTTNPNGAGGPSDGHPPQQEFIFRPIDLNNMFPNREPRWNWSNVAKTRLIAPKHPSVIISEVENVGQGIYNNNDELDYEFNLTRNQIKAIRNYNNSKQSYLDYDMYCRINPRTGMNLCSSTFIGDGLGNSQYVTTVKRGLFGCNNQKGDTCIDSYTGGN